MLGDQEMGTECERVHESPVSNHTLPVGVCILRGNQKVMARVVMQEGGSIYIVQWFSLVSIFESMATPTRY